MNKSVLSYFKYKALYKYRLLSFITEYQHVVRMITIIRSFLRRERFKIKHLFNKEKERNVPPWKLVAPADLAITYSSSQPIVALTIYILLKCVDFVSYRFRALHFCGLTQFYVTTTFSLHYTLSEERRDITLHIFTDDTICKHLS